jgi:hypothetical protein
MTTLLAMLAQMPNADQLDSLVAIIGILSGLAVVIAIVIGVAFTKIRHKEAERDMFARRLAYEQRMKELEVEALRLRAEGAPEAMAR